MTVDPGLPFNAGQEKSGFQAAGITGAIKDIMPFQNFIDSDRIKDLKHLAVDTDKSLGNLLEEAIKDIVEKYRDEIESDRP